MKPLKITAHLRSGFTSKFDWSVSIDGIIAYQFMLEKLGIDKFIETQAITSEQEPITGLPLAAERYGDDWWYQCSRPFFKSFDSHIKNIHRRFNAQEAERYVGDKTKKVETTKGAYRNARLPKKIIVTPKIDWYVIGDKDEIRRLLSSVTHVGAQRRIGYGSVARWEVEDCQDAEFKARFMRALPVQFAEENNVNGLTMDWHIRPPARHPDNTRLCVIPENDY